MNVQQVLAVAVLTSGNPFGVFGKGREAVLKALNNFGRSRSRPPDLQSLS